MPDSPVTITSPLPPEDLLFGSMTVQQGISAIDEIELHLLSEKADLAAEDLLGQPLNVALLLRDGEKRHIGGLVTRFGIGAPQGRFHGYTASVRPWLWFLTRTSDCRIFQEMSTPEIVKAVFADHAGIAKFSDQLQRSYRKRVYCVQYRETDYGFVARLMEDEGIYWHFKHSEAGPELVLVDDVHALAPIAGTSTLPYYPRTGQAPPDVDHVQHWEFSRGVRTGKTVLSSYDFERPAMSLRVSGAHLRGHELADLEHYDYQGDYVQRADGEQLNRTRLDELQTEHERLSGTTNAPAMAAGGLFNLAKHPRDDQNTQYLCVQARLTAQVQSLEAGGTTAALLCSFSAVPASQVFRPQRRTPKPFVQGPQTAVVVGPAGQEIHTDQYGRVKVQFHWDRYGQRNDKSSCWVRVSSPWAGKSFGFMQVPRIGQEVVVDFLEGDPDQPLITGRVYNADQMPPWELPANATQSGVLSRSSLGGAYGHANALRFEDKKGEEQLWLHAEKDQLTEVEHDEDKWVGNDRRKTIDRDETNHVKRDRTETVDRNEKITVHGWRTEEVDLDETITIHKNRSERVDLDEKISIGLNRTESVGVNESITIGANRSVNIGGNKTETIAMAKAETIGLAKALSIGLGYQTTVGGAMNTTVGLMQAAQIGASKSTDVGKSYSITAGDEFSVKVGASSLVLKSDGTVLINGKQFEFTASGPVQITGKDIDLN